MKQQLITLWVTPDGLRDHKGDPKINDIRVTWQLAALPHRVILQGKEKTIIAKCPLLKSGEDGGLKDCDLEFYITHHAKVWGPGDGGELAKLYGGEVVVVFDGEKLTPRHQGVIGDGVVIPRLMQMFEAIIEARLWRRTIDVEKLLSAARKIKLEDGDLLLMRVPEPDDVYPTVTEAQQLSNEIKTHFGLNVLFAVLPHNYDIERIPADMAKALLQDLAKKGK